MYEHIIQNSESKLERKESRQNGNGVIEKKINVANFDNNEIKVPHQKNVYARNFGKINSLEVKFKFKKIKIVK